MSDRKKCAKTGRNSRKPTTQRYWATGRLQKHREARVKKHILANPNDHAAVGALARIENEPVQHVLKGIQNAPLPKRK